MIKTRRNIGAAAIAIGVALAALQPTTAFAAGALGQDKASESPASASSLDAQYDGIFVVNEPAAETVAGSETFFPIPESAKNSLIVMPEVARDLGMKPGAVPKSEESAAFTKVAGSQASAPKSSSTKGAKDATVTPMATSSYWTSFWAPTGGAWSGEIRRNGSFSGSSGKYYDWALGAGTMAQVCTQGVGYYQGYNGSQMGLWRAWYGLGCGQSKYGTYVPWDNVSAYPAFKASSYNWYGGSGQFQ